GIAKSGKRFRPRRLRAGWPRRTGAGIPAMLGCCARPARWARRRCAADQLPAAVHSGGEIVDEQPLVDNWQMWDAGLSIISAALDTGEARKWWALRFTRRPVRLPNPASRSSARCRAMA